MAELKQFYSDLVLGKVASGDLGYSVNEASVTWATGMNAGALLEGSVAAGFTWAPKANAANVTGVLVDVRAIEGYETFTDATAYDFVVAVRGMTLNQNYLKYSDGDIDAAGIAVLEGLGIKVTDKVVGNQPA